MVNYNPPKTMPKGLEWKAILELQTQFKEMKEQIEQNKKAELNHDASTAFVSYQTEDQFLKEHIKEINKCYESSCYTATFILCRKVLENLLIHHILKRKYPSNKKEDREKYFDINSGRYLDFKYILKNLGISANDFGPENKLVGRICGLASGFKDDANDMTHSLYHIANKKELDEKQFQQILTMIKTLEETI